MARKAKTIVCKGDRGLRGLFLFECEQCGDQRTFYAKEEVKGSYCRKCRHETNFNELHKAFMQCPNCEDTRVYITNATTNTVTVQCRNCGRYAYIDGFWNEGKNCYITPNRKKER